jgi:hypothetical protein
MTTPTFGAITIICFVVGAWLKAFAPAGSNKAIPAALMSLGAVLGLAAFFLVPGFPADNFLDALAVGAVSGAASTGIHQIYRQAEKELRDDNIIDLDQTQRDKEDG